MPTFISLAGIIDDDIDKFTTAVHGTNSGRTIAQSIYIPVVVIMHLKALRFELDDRNKFNSLPDAAMLAAICIAQLIFMRSTRNQYARDTEILKNNFLPELTDPKFTTSNFESVVDNFKSNVSLVDGIYGFSID